LAINTDVKIKKATMTDLQYIANLHAKSWQENYHQVLCADYLKNKVLAERMVLWSKRLSTPASNQCVFIAVVDGELAGFICILGANHKTYGTIIDNLHVKANYQGQGLGTMLLNVAALWVSEYYPNLPLYLEVLACNPNAIGFYASLGATKVASAYWHTPCNNQAKEYVYAWPSPERLLENSSGIKSK
jgi:GNAT superfamily N-acetyltransferase